MKKITHQLALSLLVFSLSVVSVSAGDIGIPTVRAPISNTQTGITAQAGDIGVPTVRQSGYAEQLLVSITGLLPKLF